MKRNMEMQDLAEAAGNLQIARRLYRMCPGLVTAHSVPDRLAEAYEGYHGEPFDDAAPVAGEELLA